MTTWLRGLRQLFVPGGLLLLAACGGSEPEDPALVRAHDWQAQQSVSEQAAREQQAREDAQAAELRQVELALESDPPDTLSEAQFLQVLEYYCGACHSPTPGLQEQNFSLFFQDLQHMIERSRVLPGDAEGSPIIVHMRADQMPPEGWNTPPVSDVAIQLVADFINQLPAESDERASGR
jgi:hypothetical protein